MLNVKMLQRIKKQILKNPDSFDMDTSIYGKGCNTVGCIAGWACVFNCRDKHKKIPSNTYGILNEACNILGVDHHYLFYTGDWEYPYNKRYDDAQDNKTRARVTADYINYICDKKKKNA